MGLALSQHVPQTDRINQQVFEICGVVATEVGVRTSPVGEQIEHVFKPDGSIGGEIAKTLALVWKTIAIEIHAGSLGDEVASSG